MRLASSGYACCVCSLPWQRWNFLFSYVFHFLRRRASMRNSSKPRKPEGIARSSEVSSVPRRSRPAFRDDVARGNAASSGSHRVRPFALRRGTLDADGEACDAPREVGSDTKVVIIQPGGNDAWRGGCRFDARTNVTEMAQRLRSRHIKPILLLQMVGIAGKRNLEVDGQHFNKAGHAAIAAWLLPRVAAALR